MRISIAVWSIAALLAAAVSVVRADQSADFRAQVVPVKYPQLTSWLKSEGALKLDWQAKSGAPQSLTAQLTKEGHVVVETTVTMRSKAGKPEPGKVVMTDFKRTGKLGRIVYIAADGSQRAQDDPADGMSNRIWDNALLTIFQLSKCCQK